MNAWTCVAAAAVLCSSSALAGEAPDGPPKVRSGGLLVGGNYGTDGGSTVTGIHVVAATRLSGGTRVGASLAFQDESTREARGEGSLSTLVVGRGQAGRIGLVLSRGSPWEDSIVGFQGEVGVAAGRLSGSRLPALTGVDLGSSFECLGSQCYSGAGAAITSMYVSPYLEWSLILQVPLRGSVPRPWVGLTGLWVTDAYAGSTLYLLGEGGLA